MSELAEIERLIRSYEEDVLEIVATLAGVDADGNEPHDTERPPAFDAEEAGTFEPTVRTLCDADELGTTKWVETWNDIDRVCGGGER